MATAPPPLSVAVVGGGLSGSSAAWRLAQCGHSVHVFDLGSRQPGGRASTRRVPSSPSGTALQFDHGAQFLASPNAPELQALVAELQAAGRLSVWDPDVAELNVSSGTVTPKAAAQQPGFFGALSPGPLYVGAPTMDAICSHLTGSPGVTLRLGTKVTGGTYDVASKRWRLSGSGPAVRPAAAAGSPQPPSPSGQLGEFDALVMADILCGRQGSPGYVTADGESAQAALASFYAAAAACKRTPLFSLMLAFHPGSAPKLPFDAASFSGAGSSLAWLARDSSKPGRAGSNADALQCWVAISSEAFAAELLWGAGGAGSEAASQPLPPQDESYLAERAARMLEAARRDLGAAGLHLPEPTFMKAHRWGSAYHDPPLGVPCIAVANTRFAAAGDFCLGAGIENALRSGVAAADALIASG